MHKLSGEERENTRSMCESEGERESKIFLHSNADTHTCHIYTAFPGIREETTCSPEPGEACSNRYT